MTDDNKLIEEGWKEHPIHKKYYGFNNGDIYSLVSKQKLNGYIHNGYNKIFINKVNYCRHRFIYECFNGPIIYMDQIDHINNNKLDNSINNLQALNQKDHNKKTVTDEIRIKQNISKSKLIVLETFDNNGDIIETNIYNSLELSKKLNLHVSNIREFARFNKKYKNYKLSYKKEIKKNEIWKKINDEQFKGYEFSNMGRIKNTQNRITYGSNHTTGYMLINLNYKKYNVHYLICLAFHGKPNGIYGKEISVDHIDQNKKNNKSINLRWATLIEQANNTSKSKKIKAIYDDTDEEIGIYSSASDAKRKLNIGTSEILKACKSGKLYGKINNRKIKWIYI